MTNKQLLFLVALINVIMMFLLIYKQNKIIKELYQLQQLHEKKNELLELKKELLLQLHHNTQLSKIEQVAHNTLHLKRMTLKDVSKIEQDTTASCSAHAHKDKDLGIEQNQSGSALEQVQHANT